jgi:hypothetical protein
MFENRVVKRIFGPKMNEVTGDWRGFYNERVHGSYFCQNIIWEIE